MRIENLMTKSYWNWTKMNCLNGNYYYLNLNCLKMRTNWNLSLRMSCYWTSFCY